jgi:asparagine synthetase B (glutamine-hydrolysing)
MISFCLNVIHTLPGAHRPDHSNQLHAMPGLWSGSDAVGHRVTVNGHNLAYQAHDITAGDAGRRFDFFLKQPSAGSFMSLVMTPGQVEIDIDLPLVAVYQLFLDCHPDAHVTLTTDARLLRHNDSQARADPKTLYALMQFGCSVAPFGPWKHVQKLLPGHRHHIKISHGLATLDSHLLSSSGPEPVQSKVSSNKTTRELDNSICQAIDTSLAQCVQNKSPVILFSGGVDSSLMVARLRAMGVSDMQGIHYSICTTDASTQLAVKMADALQLPLEIAGPGTGCSVDAVAELVDNFGKWYVTPFADHSAIPTSALSRIVAERFSGDRPVLDGTGADGLFGLCASAHAWHKVHQLPAIVRRLAWRIYGALGMAARTSKSEYRLRVLGRSSSVPFPLSIIANNPLQNIAYHFDPADVDAVHQHMYSPFDDLMRNTTPGIQASVMDVIHVCCAIFAQKNVSFFLQNPGGIRYPFLSPAMTRPAWTEPLLQRVSDAPKAVLKRILARSVPAELVYHQKLGFIDNLSALFSHPAVQNEMQKLQQRTGVVGQYIKPYMIDMLRRRTANKITLPAQTYSWLWGAIATNIWYRPVP